MATGGESEEVMSEEYSRSLSIHVNYCDPCQDDDIQIQAEGFCVDCNDYLCQDCYKSHRKPKTSRHHVLQDKVTMPVCKPSKVTITEKCPIHEHESIKWYCEFHDVTLCDLCHAAQHKRCKGVKTITDVSSDIFSSPEFTIVKERLTDVKDKFTKHMTDVKVNIVEVEDIYNKVVKEITKILSNIRDRDLENLTSLENMCDALLKTTGSFVEKLESFEKSGRKEQAFLSKRRAESQLSLFEETMKSIQKDNIITRYRFVQTPPYIKSAMIGTLCETKYRRTPVKLDDINVKTPSDTSDCSITGIDRLDDNRLVVADSKNSKVKLVDLTKKNVTAELRVDVSPWDLTKIDDKNIAVTTYDNKNILLISTSETLVMNRTIDKGNFNHCQGIVYDNGSLVVSYDGPVQIQILDLNGTVTHTIDSKDKYGTVRFGDVRYIAKNPDTDSLYLSDLSNNKILSMTRDGKIISSFSHQHLRGPRGITLGRDGRVFLCSYWTHKIYELSSDLSKGEIILDQQNGIEDPCSIVYDDDEYKLYIGSYNNNNNNNENNIQVFLV